MQIASFTTNSIVRVACCCILVSPLQMGWSSIQACSVWADFSVKPLMRASLRSFRCVSTRCVVLLMYTFLQMHGPGMFGMGRLFCEAFDACILMLFQMCFKSTCSLANVHLSADAWHFVDDVCLLLHRERIFDFSEERTEGGSRLEHRSDVEVLAYPPDQLSSTSYVREVDSGWPILLPWWSGCRGRTDGGARITIPYESLLRWFSSSSRFCPCCAMHLT